MKIKENYVMREVAGQAIVIAIGEESERFKGMINLNRTGRDVWLYMEKGLDSDEIAKNDIESMIDRLYKAGVLEK